MNTPWFFGTEDAARLVLRANEEDYRQFLEASYSPITDYTGDRWYAATFIFFANLLIISGLKIKKAATSRPRTSFQTR
ncbi:MAG TPA: hypothetical protein DCG54_03065 [Anaerolineae bacterium]|jgi:hypothetical protein|nr:hypothetical protein [Anaerolineae bacterium]